MRYESQAVKQLDGVDCSGTRALARDYIGEVRFQCSRGSCRALWRGSPRYHGSSFIRPIREKHGIGGPGNRRGNADTGARVILVAECPIGDAPKADDAHLLPKSIAVHKRQVTRRDQARAVRREADRADTFIWG